MRSLSFTNFVSNFPHDSPVHGLAHKATPDMIKSFLHNKGLTSQEIQVALEVAAQLRTLPRDGPEGMSESSSAMQNRGVEAL